MTPRYFKISALIVVASLSLTGRAFAHAFLDHAEPRVGSKVGSAPTQVKIWFTQQPERAFSVIQVYDAKGTEVDKADTHADPNDPNALVVSLAALAPGNYRVTWHVLSIDTHRTQGDFNFTIKP